ncbi:MAG: RNA polymerase sigma factor [Acidimicrobiales bacterium]
MNQSVAVRLPPFQGVLDANRDAVWRFLVASVGRHDAADCFQETMISALRAYPALASDSNLRGWLFTIAHHKVIDLARARGRRPLTTDAPPEQAVDDDAAHAVIEADGDLWMAVDRLPPKQRMAVVARFVNDLPYADIAAMAGGTEAAARQNVRAGLATLRKVVKR